MNAGAKDAQGRILIFLHADTFLPTGFAPAVRAALKDSATVAGAFSFKTDSEGFLARLFERGTNRRCRRYQTPYGDQAIFMEKRVFEEAGGYAEMPIMEDYEFIRRLRRRGRIALLDLNAITSGRRLQALGVLPATILNQIIIWAYHCGVAPRSLAKLYRNIARNRSG